MSMSNDSQTPQHKPSDADDQTVPFEPILDEKLSRFLNRMDDELGTLASDDTAK